MPPPIFFYRTTDPYGSLSNFSKHRIWLDGKLWLTAEHYFQAQKFAGTEHEESVRMCPTAREAANMGRERTRPLRPDWPAVRDDVMRRALHAKFTQHPSLRAELLSTGTAALIEHTANDRYWADGGDGTGENKLGHLLMELREKLRTESARDVG